MRHKIFCSALVILFVTGALLFSQGLTIQAKAVVAQVLLEHAWQRSQSNAQGVKPWSWADTWPVARLQIQRLGIDTVVLEGESGHVLAFAPGHLIRTALPGEAGVSVIGAHRDTHFRPLQHIRQGDLIRLETLDRQVLSYTVKQTMVVTSEQADLMPSETRSGLILFTCYPFNAVASDTPLRFLVYAFPAVQPAQEYES